MNGYLKNMVANSTALCKSLLVIDDNPVNRKLLASILRKEGYEVATAAGGEEGLMRAQQELFDLILLDIVMPEMDGVSVCRALQQNEFTRDVPIIMVSSLEVAETKIQCFDLGAVDYITKPFHGGEVLARIRSQLQIRELTKSLQESNKQLRKRQDVIDRDLEAAAVIQRVLLPEKFPFKKRLQGQYSFQPCERIGGDIFNVFALDEHSVGIYIVDVCGHGVPAAMVATLVSQAMSPVGNLVKTVSATMKTYQIASPLQVLEQLDTEFPFERFNQYFTICYMLLDLQTGSFSYSSAGHPPVLLQQHNGELSSLDVGGTVIGLGDLALAREEGTGNLHKGDRLFFYTDGLVEVENAEGEIFGAERIKELICQQRTIPLNQIRQFICRELERFSPGVLPADDISLLAIEYLG